MQSSPQTIAVEAFAASATGTVAGIDSDAEQSQSAAASAQSGRTTRCWWTASCLLHKAKGARDNVDHQLERAEAAKSATTKPAASYGDFGRQAHRCGSRADISLKLSAVEGSAKALKVAALALELDAKQKDNAVKGTFSTPIVGNLQTRRVRAAEDRRLQFNVTESIDSAEDGDVPLDRLGARRSRQAAHSGGPGTALR